MNKRTLLNDLEMITQQNIKTAKQLQEHKFELLNHKQNESAWSALECIEHLNRYADFYTPELEGVIAKSKQDDILVFKSGWLGNYFAKSMRLKPKLSKMKTFKDMNPNQSTLNMQVISIFLNHQKSMLKALSKAQGINLSKNKTKVSISNVIKLRIGDTLRVVIYHNERHLAQAVKAAEKAS